MGKKSRRQREKDPVNEMVKYQARQTGEGKRQALRRMKEALNSMHPRSAPSVAPAPNVARDDDDDSELDAVQDAAPAASKPTVAEAEAEYRAAMSPDGFTQERGWDATMYLRDALTIDEDDQNNFDAYIGIVSPRLCVTGESELVSMKILKAMKRWPRYRKYWPRIRRRICWGCGKEYDLSAPRIWVCGGCGDARYCSETCQGAHWPEHKTPCLEKFMENVKKRRAQGQSVKKIRQELLEWYGLPYPGG